MPDQAQVSLEERYRRIFETYADGILVLDAEAGKILDLNNRLPQLIGCSREELLGQKIWHLLPFQQGDLGRTLFSECKHQDIISREAVLLRADGSRLECELLCHAYTEGNHRFICCDVRDISGRKRAEEALRRREESLRLQVEGVREFGIIMLDADGTVESWNRGAERISGHPADEMIGHGMDVLLSPEDRERGVLRQAFKAAEREGSLEHEGWYMRKDGSRYFVSSVITPLWTAEGRLRGFVKIMRDITDKKRMEQTLRQYQKLESVGVLAGGVAHDFNNLLTGILGNSSFALDQLPSDSPAHQMIEQVIDAARRAADLTRQLLAYAGKGRLRRDHLNLSDVLIRIMDLIHAAVPDHVALDLQLQRHLPPIEADPTQMQQIVMNLVTNAAESIEGNGRIRIATGVKRFDAAELARTERLSDLEPGSYVCLEVEDTGAGMPEETKAKVFEPFFSTKFTGRGLGLGDVDGIVRCHRGAIEVGSAPGEGSTFSVYLPVAQAGQSLPHAPHETAPTILVADDDEIVRSVSRRALEKSGYRVLLAKDGREALDIMNQYRNEVGAVVLDMAMPVMSGEEAYPRLRTIKPDIPILISTGYSAQLASERFGAPLNWFIQKPFTSWELAEKVRTVLRQ